MLVGAKEPLMHGCCESPEQCRVLHGAQAEPGAEHSACGQTPGVHHPNRHHQLPAFVWGSTAMLSCSCLHCKLVLLLP